MQTVSITEAKKRFLELLAIVENGEVVVITRRGRPVARLEARAPAAGRHPSGNPRARSRTEE
jgi:antitoxin (DNA-binding transcriptional repressor) of toxin-antitoxin stability system